MSGPTVSVVIPAYNAEDTILGALDSVMAQTFRDFEVIVVDDCSLDRTVEVVRGYSSASRPYATRGTLNATVFALSRNAGPAAARNKGIEAAKGEWIAFLDADDAWLPAKLEIQMKLAEEHPEVDMWCSGAEPVGVQGIAGRRRENAQGANLTRLPLEAFAIMNPVGTSTVLVRKSSVVDAGGFDEQFRGPEDYDLWMRIAAGHRIVSDDRVLCRYLMRPGTLCMDDSKFLPQVLRVLDKAYGKDGVLAAMREKKKSAVAAQFWQASWMAFCAGRRMRAIGHLCRFLLQCFRARVTVRDVTPTKFVKRFCRLLVGTIPRG